MLTCHQSLVETLEVQDVEAFTDAVKAYDSISRLDPWYSSRIHRLHKSGLRLHPKMVHLVIEYICV